MVALCNGAPTGEVGDAGDAPTTPIIDPIYYADLSAQEESLPQAGWLPHPNIADEEAEDSLSTEGPYLAQVDIRFDSKFLIDLFNYCLIKELLQDGASDPELVYTTPEPYLSHQEAYLPSQEVSQPQQPYEP